MFITFLLHNCDKPDALTATEVTRMKEGLMAWLGRHTYPRRVTGHVTLHENIFKLQCDKSTIELVSLKLSTPGPLFLNPQKLAWDLCDLSKYPLPTPKMSMP